MATVRCTYEFTDLAARCERHIGEEWEVSEKRLDALLAYPHAKLVEVVVAEPVCAEAAKPARKCKPTKAELVAEAESLGIKVPAKATNAQIAKLIEEAR